MALIWHQGTVCVRVCVCLVFVMFSTSIAGVSKGQPWPAAGPS